MNSFSVYNGSEEQPETYKMSLSDSYEKKTEEPQLELVCKVYNINYGKNKNFLERCSVLREYTIFVDYVRYYHKKQEYENLETREEGRAEAQIALLCDFLKMEEP